MSARIRVLQAGAVALAPALVCTSCLKPEDDYNAYVARAADAQAPMAVVATQDAAADAPPLKAPAASFDDKGFVMICLSQLAPDVSKALLWKIELDYVASGGGGSLTYTSRSLPAGATSIDNTLDPTLNETGTIAPSGTGTISIGMTTLPAAANAITNVPVPLANAVMEFRIGSPTQICANLGANVTAPAPVTLNPPQNPCIFLPTDSGGHWGPVTTGDIHCP